MKISLGLVGVLGAVHATANTLPPGSASDAIHAQETQSAPAQGHADAHASPGKLGTRTVQPKYDDANNEPPKATAECDGPSINETDYKVAVANMLGYCQYYHVPRHSLYAAVVDQAVVYACSRGGAQDCGPQQFARVEELLDNECPGKPGHVTFGKLTYGRDVAGRIICRNFNFNAYDYEVEEGNPVWANGMMWEEWKWGEH